MARLGPDNGDLKIHTHRDGVAARAGHDLVLRVGRWEAEVDLDGEPSVTLTAHPDAIEVLEGHGGAKPLSDRDRRDIRRNLVDKVLGPNPVTFRTTGAEGRGDGRWALTGDLTIAGTTAPVTWELVQGAGGTLEGEAVVAQSRFGVKPYTALFGALRVADEVEVRFTGTAG